MGLDLISGKKLGFDKNPDLVDWPFGSAIERELN